MADKPTKPKRKRYPKGSAKPGEVRAPTGGQLTYNPDTWAELIARLSAGEPLQQICRDDGMPSAGAVYAWTDPDGVRRPKDVPTTLADDFARARACGHDAIAADTLEIADNGKNDWMQRHGSDSPGWEANGEHIQRSKLRIETRLKLLAKWDKRYADRGLDVQAGVQIVVQINEGVL
jgi:hypothetical protein